MKLVTSINGKIVRRGQDKISVFDNALLYAEGLFETCLAVDGKIVFLKQHLDRLYQGARVIGMKLPIDRETLADWMQLTTRAHPDKIIKLRLTVSAGESARWVGRQGETQVIISAAPHEIPTRPFRLSLSQFRVDQDSVFRRIKTLSYIIHATALAQAKRARYDDALLLNERAYVAEVTSANIFWARGGRIFTPPLSSGCLDGVTRKFVMTELAYMGLKVFERNGTISTLAKADEVFISSSLKLVIGVDRIKTPDAVLRFKPGILTAKLRSRFTEIVGL